MDEAALRPEDARAEFTYPTPKEPLKLGEKLFHSIKTELDVWICRIDIPFELKPLNTSIHKPVVADEGERKQRIYVIGHPNGNELSISFYGNELAGYENQYVRYKSPTDGGNSGSPVMNERLKTFAIHHAAREQLKLNEGILLESIKDQIS